VETTVWRISGTLVRVKEEQDSDFHLIIADSGGRTMITEIPAPACVSSSPFLPSERYVRSLFTADFHPTTSWQRPGVRITVKGVGFFDFLHGQSGVAPNGIELHPLLGFSLGASSDDTPPPPPSPKPTSTATAAATPTSTTTQAPTFTPTAQQSITVTARVSNAYPPRYSTVTVYGQITGAGAGVPMSTTWHYKTTTSYCSGVTDGSGLASCSRSIGGATAGYFVSIDVSFSYGGQFYTAQTGFTPQ